VLDILLQNISVVTWKQDLASMKGIKIIKEQLVLMSLKFFLDGAKGLGKSSLKRFDKEFDTMVWYVLDNCEEIESYIE
jgi:hypothetical protein